MAALASGGPTRGVRAVDMTRNCTFHFQSYDIRRWKINETMRRYMIGLQLGGASWVSGVGASAPKIKRWCVNKSPHIDKISMQHFEMITNRRHLNFTWDLKAQVDDPSTRKMPIEIAKRNVENVSARLEMKQSALLFLPEIFDALANPGKYPSKEQEVTFEEIRDAMTPRNN